MTKRKAKTIGLFELYKMSETEHKAVKWPESILGLRTDRLFCIHRHIIPFLFYRQRLLRGFGVKLQNGTRRNFVFPALFCMIPVCRISSSIIVSKIALMTNPLKQQGFPFLIESEPVSQQEEIMADAMRSYEESIEYILRDEELAKAVAVEFNKMRKQEDDNGFLSPLAFADFFLMSRAVIGSAPKVFAQIA